jgi:hypothetical protein
MRIIIAWNEAIFEPADCFTSLLMTDSIKKFLSAVKNRRTQKGDAIFNRVFSFFPLSSSHCAQLKIG